MRSASLIFAYCPYETVKADGRQLPYRMRFPTNGKTLLDDHANQSMPSTPSTFSSFLSLSYWEYLALSLRTNTLFTLC